MKERKITLPKEAKKTTEKAIKLPEGITENSETKIYRVDYQEGGKANLMLSFASKEKALEYGERIASKNEVGYVRITEHKAIDGGIFEPSGLVREWGKFNDAVE